MAETTQFELTTPLGANVLLFSRLNAGEALSQVADFQIECLSSETDVDLDSILGKQVSLRVGLPDDKERFFCGYVTAISHLGTEERYQAYRLQVRPWLWFLTRTADCRIFQSKTVPDIIKEVFADHAISEVRDALTGKYSTWDYCVQYRESDYNFVSRLMEQEGIYYYFEYKKDKNVLVLADAYSAHKPIEGEAEIEFLENAGAKEESDYISSWSYQRQVQPGKTVLADYDFTKPSVKLEGSAAMARSHGEGKHEVYDYPGEFDQAADGKHYAQVRIDEYQAQFEVAQGRSNARRLSVGQLFKLKGHARKDQNREYLLTATTTLIRAEGHESGRSAGSTFQCSFSTLNSHQDYRPPRNTAKPIVQGPQTAIVVGPSGDEIYTDKYGRVKVQFHWDRYGKKDEHSSCWVRVSHPWAGKNWGFIAIPRIGQEVIVEFLEGDPDQPIITGRVYNADQMPPYDLPANMTQTGVKTRSTKGGGVANFNEIRFEDKKGSEQLFIHAEKNQDIEVENDETHWVGHDRKKTVDNDETVHVKSNRTETVGAEEKITIGANRTESVGASEKITIAANRTESVGANEQISIGANRTESVGASESITVGASQSVTVGASQTVSVGGSKSETIGAGLTQTVGGSWNMTAAGPVTITAPAGLTIISPGGNRTIDNMFDKIGGFLSTKFGTQSTVAGSSYQATGVAIAQTALKLETTLESISATGINMETKGLNMAYVVLKCEKASFEIKTADAHIIA
ncbi:type VI secretion system tip protein TssI/VgrG [Uliginosibacterium sp. H3]|uniref:Type VI secretion system tip protein TssI/VgrG n=1 Tax=Uliginosibacterium silvisoli TaxID=3114758 RepID=A0ABU6K535_9RHOO|nr:type VI secretion system tip protein TssI/VgrG [Uliginosibacterium sp. H3]